MTKDEFSIDPRNKLGDCDWTEGLDDFAAALNRGDSSLVRPAGVEGMAELPNEHVLDANSLDQLRHLFSNYR